MKKIGGKDPPLRLDSTGYFKLHRDARNGRIGKPPRNLDRPINTKPTARCGGGFLMPLVRAPRHTERE